MKESDISHHDRILQYQGTVVLYRGDPVYVLDVGDKMMQVLDLITQQTAIVEFKFKDITPPTRRIGMVNILGSAAYVTRQPVRRVQVGLSSASIKVDSLPFVGEYNRVYITESIKTLKCVELGKAMNGDYPSLQKAFQMTQDKPSCVAFDHQFAITSKREIIYKTEVVGGMSDLITSEGIRFKPQFAYLINLLDGNHEKTYRAS